MFEGRALYFRPETVLQTTTLARRYVSNVGGDTMPEEVDIPLEWLAAFVLVGWIVALPTSSRANDLASNIEYQRDDESQIVGRVRVVGVPNVALGAMYDYHASSWQDGEPSLAYGVEFLWRKVDAFELSAALEYADLGMTGSYWKRSDAKAIGSDWVEFDLAMASAATGTGTRPTGCPPTSGADSASGTSSARPPPTIPAPDRSANVRFAAAVERFPLRPVGSARLLRANPINWPRVGPKTTSGSSCRSST
jgi:hypothetical protein